MELRYNQKAALQNFTKKHSRWYKAGVEQEEIYNDLAVQRINSGIVSPTAEKFSIDKNSKVFAIGSCFARGVEKKLATNGLNVLSISDQFKSFELKNEQVSGLGFTNKYSTYSILNQLQWSLGEREFPERSIVDIGEHIFVDPHTNPALKFVNRDRTIERRKILNNVFGEVKNSNLIVITLGLIELWYDKACDVYLNMTPTQTMLKANPDRYEFLVSDFNSNYENVDQTIQLLNRHCPKDFQIVITVSPVPLLATFSGRDIILANTYSKSLLRTVADSIAMKNDNVHYFPSYEMVMNSDSSKVWEQDLRHVQGSFVQNIMGHFMSNHIVG